MRLAVRARAVCAPCILASTLWAGCKKSTPDALDASPSTPNAAVQNANDNANGNANDNSNGNSGGDDPSTTSAPTFVPPEIEHNPDVVVLGVDTTVVPGNAPKPPAPVDPYVAVIDSARASAVGCFAPLPPGTYASTIVVTITPAGTPIDVQVQPGNVTDAAVIACLKQVGESRSYPSTPNGRTIQIDVRVQG